MRSSARHVPTIYRVLLIGVFFYNSFILVVVRDSQTEPCNFSSVDMEEGNVLKLLEQ